MKKIILFGVSMAAVVLIIAVIWWHRSFPPAEDFYGYIPVRANPHFIWAQEEPGLYFLSGNILVVTPDDVVTAYFDPEGNFLGRRLVLYRNTHPEAKGKIIFVKGEIIDGLYVIKKASTEKFE